jgi:hypothetical protein
MLQHLDPQDEVEDQGRERQPGDVGVRTDEPPRPPAGGEGVVVEVDAHDERIGIEGPQVGADLALAHPDLQHRRRGLARERVRQRGEETSHETTLDWILRPVLVVGVARRDGRGHVVAPELARCGRSQRRWAFTDAGLMPPLDRRH